MKYFWPNFAEKVKGNRGRRYGLRKKKERKEGGEKKKIGQSQLVTIALLSMHNGLLRIAQI